MIQNDGKEGVSMKAKKILLCAESALLLLAIIGKIGFVLYTRDKDVFDYYSVNLLWHLTLINPLLQFFVPLVLCQWVTGSWKMKNGLWATISSAVFYAVLFVYLFLYLLARFASPELTVPYQFERVYMFYLTNSWVLIAAGVGAALSPFLGQKSKPTCDKSCNA